MGGLTEAVFGLRVRFEVRLRQAGLVTGGTHQLGRLFVFVRKFHKGFFQVQQIIGRWVDRQFGFVQIEFFAPTATSYPLLAPRILNKNPPHRLSRSGEFIASEVETLMNKDELVRGGHGGCGVGGTRASPLRP